MPDLSSQLESLAQRGELRGAEEVLRRARADAHMPARPRRRRRPVPALVIGAICLVLMVPIVAYATVSHRDHGATVDTSPKPTFGPNATATAPATTVTAVTAPLGTLLTVAPRTDLPAPYDQSLQPSLLRVGDWPGSTVTTLAAAETTGSAGLYGVLGEFSPCGYPFDDTSTASGHATTTLASFFDASGLEYVYEDVAAFTLSQAEQLMSAFHQRAASCPSVPGFGGHLGYNDIPVIDGISTGWQIEPVTIALGGGEVDAVNIAKSDRDYYLVVIRKGRYAAFLRVLDCECGIPPEPGRTLDRIIATAAARLPLG